MPANEAIPEASGDVIPHPDNPMSQGDDIDKAMAAAQKAADDAAAAAAGKAGAGETDETPLGGETAGAESSGSETGDGAPATEDSQGGQGSGGAAPGEQDAQGEALPPLDPPTTWDAEVQDVFRSMPRDAQEWVLARHEADVAAVRSEFDGLDPYRAIHQQWSPYFAQHGFEPGIALDNLLRTEFTLRTGTPEQKVAALNHIIGSYGLAQSLGLQPGQQVAPGGTPGAPGQTQQLPDEVTKDPLYTALNGQIQTLAQSVQSLTTKFGEQMTGMQQRQNEDSRQAVESFWAEKDAAGKPAHPYRQEVQAVMQGIATTAMQAGQTPTLQEVYDQACWAVPSVRAKLQSAERAAGIAERQAQAGKKAAASSSVSGSPGGQVSNGAANYDPNETIEQTIEKAMALHSGSG